MHSSAQWVGDGNAAIGYYTATQLPFYYDLFNDSALVANYFCSLLGPTWPYRFYFAAGTSGGVTTNGLWGYGIFDYPIILDLLDEAGITWKVYNNTWDSVPFGNTDNVFVFWKKYAHDNRTRGSKGAFLNDARRGRLPQVSWIIPSFARGLDEHPPADVSVGMQLQQELITAVRQSPQWQSSAFLLTYDEHGGFFDHVAPSQIDAFGLGVRVPLWVVSPYAKKGRSRPACPRSTRRRSSSSNGCMGYPRSRPGTTCSTPRRRPATMRREARLHRRATASRRSTTSSTVSTSEVSINQAWDRAPPHR